MPGRERDRLIISDLLPECEDEDLRSHFGRFGGVSEATVARERSTTLSRCFGYIRMQNYNLVQQILKDEHSIWGRPVTVKLDTGEFDEQNTWEDPRKDRRTDDRRTEDRRTDDRRTEEHHTEDRRAEDDGKRIYVGKLVEEHTEDVLRDYFSNFGQVESVKLLTEKDGTFKKCAFVNMAEQAVVAKILEVESHEVNGSTIAAKPYFSKKTEAARRDNKRPRDSDNGDWGSNKGGKSYGKGDKGYGGYQYPGYGMMPPGFGPYGSPMQGYGFAPYGMPPPGFGPPPPPPPGPSQGDSYGAGSPQHGPPMGYAGSSSHGHPYGPSSHGAPEGGQSAQDWWRQSSSRDGYGGNGRGGAYGSGGGGGGGGAYITGAAEDDASSGRNSSGGAYGCGGDGSGAGGRNSASYGTRTRSHGYGKSTEDGEEHREHRDGTSSRDDGRGRSD